VTVDEFLSEQQWIDRVRACVDTEVRHRPPVPGVVYSAFSVLSPDPGGPVTLAVGHCLDGKSIVDLVRQYPDAAASLFDRKQYGIDTITAAISDTIEDDGLVHAVAGLIHLLRQS
jgi:hypothetical protein